MHVRHLRMWSGAAGVGRAAGVCAATETVFDGCDAARSRRRPGMRRSRRELWRRSARGRALAVRSDNRIHQPFQWILVTAGRCGKHLLDQMVAGDVEGLTRSITSASGLRPRQRCSQASKANRSRKKLRPGSALPREAR
jgi:hypothetical protein